MIILLIIQYLNSINLFFNNWVGVIMVRKVNKGSNLNNIVIVVSTFGFVVLMIVGIYFYVDSKYKLEDNNIVF